MSLHDAGFNVTLFERFEQPAAVGSGLMLQPTGLAVLEQLGLREQVEQLGQRIDGMIGRIAPAGKVVLNIDYQVLANDLHGIAIHRASLFHVLYQAVLQRSINIETGKDIVKISSTNTINGIAASVCLHEAGGVKIEQHFDLVVDASGSQSMLVSAAVKAPRRISLEYGALWTTVKLGKTDFARNLLEQRYKAASVMVGVLPCGTLPDSSTEIATLFWSVKARDYDSVLRAGISEWKKDVLSHWPSVEPLTDQLSDFSDLTYARYSHHTLSKPYGNSVVFIGDAAHSTSPQLGQGVNMALLDTAALTAALTTTAIKTSGAECLAKRLQLYARTRRAHIRLFQAASYFLTPFYQSDSRLMPLLRDTLFEPVAKLPYSDRLVTALGAGLLTKPLNRIAKIQR